MKGPLLGVIHLGPSKTHRCGDGVYAPIGPNPNHYSGHSCRAGGATDLFAAGVQYYVVKKYGRWTLDTALIY